MQRFLCIWLRAAHGLSTTEIARTLGLHVNTVRFTQKDFIDNGLSALTENRRGGRKHCLMSVAEEAAFLSQFADRGIRGDLLMTNEIKAALEERLGVPVHKTTIYRMLHRHGWRKVAPRPVHPGRDEEAAEGYRAVL